MTNFKKKQEPIIEHANSYFLKQALSTASTLFFFNASVTKYGKNISFM